MKKSRITISQQSGTSIEFELSHFKAEGEKVRRALVLRFMDYYDTLRNVGAKGFKGSEPFDITMKSGSVVVFNTATLSTEARTRLKLTNTPKGRTLFMNRLDALVGFMQRCDDLTTVEQVTDKLEAMLLTA